MIETRKCNNLLLPSQVWHFHIVPNNEEEINEYNVMKELIK